MLRNHLPSESLPIGGQILSKRYRNAMLAHVAPPAE
jgi:hypothetical protein